jgi:hypothetical protein
MKLHELIYTSRVLCISMHGPQGSCISHEMKLMRERERERVYQNFIPN